METVFIEHDIKLLCLTASTFPEGALAAHQKLHTLIPYQPQRRYFGVSRPEGNQGVIYKAAVEEMHPGEAEELGLETLTLKEGNYLSSTINDFVKNMASVGRAFDELLKQPGIDPNGYCVELYPNQRDMRCMVRLTET